MTNDLYKLIDWNGFNCILSSELCGNYDIIPFHNGLRRVNSPEIDELLFTLYRNDPISAYIETDYQPSVYPELLKVNRHSGDFSDFINRFTDNNLNYFIGICGTNNTIYYKNYDNNYSYILIRREKAIINFHIISNYIAVYLHNIIIDDFYHPQFKKVLSSTLIYYLCAEEIEQELREAMKPQR